MFKDSNMKKLILLVAFALFIQFVKGNLTPCFTSVKNVILQSEIWEFHPSNSFGFGIQGSGWASTDSWELVKIWTYYWKNRGTIERSDALILWFPYILNFRHKGKPIPVFIRIRNLCPTSKSSTKMLRLIQWNTGRLQPSAYRVPFPVRSKLEVSSWSMDREVRVNSTPQKPGVFFCPL